MFCFVWGNCTEEAETTEKWPRGPIRLHPCWCSVEQPPQLHLTHIFPCGATLFRIWTYSPYLTIYWESPFPLSSLIISTFNLKWTKPHFQNTLHFQQHCTILFDSISTDLHLQQYSTICLNISSLKLLNFYMLMLSLIWCWNNSYLCK